MVDNPTLNQVPAENQI